MSKDKYPSQCFDRSLQREIDVKSPNSLRHDRVRRELQHGCFLAIEPFDFLHPKTPAPLIDGVAMLGGFLENLPIVSEFAGSLYIRAVT